MTIVWKKWKSFFPFIDKLFIVSINSLSSLYHHLYRLIYLFGPNWLNKLGDLIWVIWMGKLVWPEESSQGWLGKSVELSRTHSINKKDNLFSQRKFSLARITKPKVFLHQHLKTKDSSNLKYIFNITFYYFRQIHLNFIFKICAWYAWGASILEAKLILLWIQMLIYFWTVTKFEISFALNDIWHQ